MQRFKTTKIASFLGIFFNLFLFVIKFIASFFTSSQAMMADAINSLGDIFSSLMTLIGNKIASKPSDDDHNLGHGKAEYIFSLFISISMIVVSLKILYDSALSIIYKNEIIFSWWLIIVCIITIVTKLNLYLYSKNALKKFNNILLESNMKDHRNDCIVTSFTTISIILSLFGVYWVDGVVGIGISVWIFYTGMKIFIESYNVLMDKSINPETKEKIYAIIVKFDGVKEIIGMHTIPTGYKYILVLTIGVDGKMETFKSHSIADKLQKEIEDKFDVIDRVIVHVEPLK